MEKTALELNLYWLGLLNPELSTVFGMVGSKMVNREGLSSPYPRSQPRLIIPNPKPLQWGFFVLGNVV